jgi:hypothetical protein
VTFVDERGQDVGELRFARSSDNKQRVTLSYRGQQIYDVSDTKKTFFGGKVRADLTAEETDLLKSLQQGLVADSVANLAQPETPEVLYATAPGTCRGPCFACSLSVVATPGFPIDELAFCIACFICLGV